MKGIFAFVIIAFGLFSVWCYVGNIAKLVACDFQAPYKGEIIHVIGLIPEVSIVTYWNNDK